MSGCSWCEDGEGAKLIERARIVGVLDAWADAGERWQGRSWMYEFCESSTGNNHCITLEYNGDAEVGHVEDWDSYTGPTPDAARAAAAKAIEAGEV